MRQLLLDLGAEKPQTFDNFFVGQNPELAERLQQIVARVSSERFVYVWGQPGAGKTHLLRAMAQAAAPAARFIASEADAAAFQFDPGVTLYLIDDCAQLSPTLQIEAFNLFNQVREHGTALVVSGNLPPANLAVREDLRTRLGWGLIYRLHELTDEDKIAALNHSAQMRGLSLSPGVLPYLLTHTQRDMRSLSTILDGLDKYSLETQRPITLSLLRSLLQMEQLKGKPKTP
ncbi:MAG: DnaA regulatory inactivator Hda [Glaciimonas sp.]|nr:DnaA regulatory inactivator Hda [Glaciimonas sp.]